MQIDHLSATFVEVSRIINAPRALVWKAMTEPEHQNKWWGPDGTRYPNHWLFKEIKPPSRWVSDHGDGQRVWFEAIITLEESTGGTLVSLLHIFPSKASRDEVVNKYGAIKGGKQHLAKLEKYLKENLR